MPTLFHFTAAEYLGSIRKDGIWRGDVPISPSTGFNAPWLTSDGSWSDQEWTSGSGLDKSAVRLTIEVPDDDPNLHQWATLARDEGMEPGWYDALDRAGGGGSAAWHVYRGNIPWDWVKRVERRQAPAQDLPQVRIQGWGVGKTKMTANLGTRLAHLRSDQGLSAPLFAAGRLDMTDKAFELISPRLDEPVSENEIDNTTMMLCRHVGNPFSDRGVASIQVADGVTYRLLTTFEPEHKTLIMLADEA